MRDGDFRRSYAEATLDYEARLIEYQANLAEYRRSMEEWNSLSTHERGELNKSAEMHSRTLWSVLLAVAASIAIYKWLEPHIQASFFLWAWGGTSVLVWVVIFGLSKFFGLIARALVFGIIGIVVGLIVFYLADTYFPSSLAGYTGQILLGVFGIFGFFFGLLHPASAVPKPPTRPRAPRRSFYQE